MIRSALFRVGPLAVFALAACSGNGQQEAMQMPPPQLGVVAVQAAEVPLRRDLVGRLAPVRSADVRARVAGVVEERVYREGSDVEEGDVLFRIDQAPLQATLAAAQAGLAQAEATYTNARIAAERARELSPKGFVSKADVDNAEAAERTAQAAVKQARATVESARINLGYATVRAPISGRAGKQQVTEGALVGQGQPTLLTTIDQIDPLYVNFSIPVADLERMRQASAAGKARLAEAGEATIGIRLPDGSLYGHEGRVNFADMVVDPATGSVTLRGEVPNPDLALMPGMYVSLDVELGSLAGAFRVPQEAVQRDPRGAFVLLVDAEGKVERRQVTTAGTLGGDWVVTEGLENGDEVVVSGLQRAVPGEPAQAVRADEANPAAAGQAPEQIAE